MKKFVMAAAALAFLSTASLADMNDDEMAAMRHDFLVSTQKMMDDQMATIKKMEEMLTIYQATLKKMMENEQGGGN
ncbi:MAG: hypothetical protein ACREDN_01625 [Aestuariivirga sp.]